VASFFIGDNMLDAGTAASSRLQQNWAIEVQGASHRQRQKSG
jgi:hypothetical protein